MGRTIIQTLLADFGEEPICANDKFGMLCWSAVSEVDDMAICHLFILLHLHDTSNHVFADNLDLASVGFASWIWVHLCFVHCRLYKLRNDTQLATTTYERHIQVCSLCAFEWQSVVAVSTTSELTLWHAVLM